MGDCGKGGGGQSSGLGGHCPPPSLYVKKCTEDEK